MRIEIINLRDTKPTMVYDARIDRDSVLGNPFYMRSEAQRDTVCVQYDAWFAGVTGVTTAYPDPGIMAELGRLLALLKQHGTIRLFCWCAPKRCHGLAIKRWLELHI